MESACVRWSSPRRVPMVSSGASRADGGREAEPQPPRRERSVVPSNTFSSKRALDDQRWPALSRGTYPIRPEAFPAVGGSEGVAEIVAVGDAVTTVESVVPHVASDGRRHFHAAAPGMRVTPAHPGAGTWRQYAVLPAASCRALPLALPVVEAAQLLVNPPTALRMLSDFVPLVAGRDTVALNAAASAVGRAALQMCRRRGVDTVAFLRPRDDPETYAADAGELYRLGASLVLPDDGCAHRSPEARAAMQKLPPVSLALNGVGGASSATLASLLREKGVMVTYGGMAKQPARVPTGALIFKDIVARGFWLTRWLADEKKAAAEAGGGGGGDDAALTSSPKMREMAEELCDMVMDGALRMPAREVTLEECLTAMSSPAEIGGRKLLIRF